MYAKRLVWNHLSKRLHMLFAVTLVVFVMTSASCGAKDAQPAPAPDSEEKQTLLNQIVREAGIEYNTYSFSYDETEEKNSIPQPAEPFVILKKTKESTWGDFEWNPAEWEFVLLENTDDARNAKVYVIVDTRWEEKTYKTQGLGAGVTVYGSSESATIYFYDVEKKCVFDREWYEGRKLKDTYGGNEAPNYTLNEEKLYDIAVEHLGLDRVTFAEIHEQESKKLDVIIHTCFAVVGIPALTYTFIMERKKIKTRFKMFFARIRENWNS